MCEREREREGRGKVSRIGSMATKRDRAVAKGVCVFLICFLSIYGFAQWIIAFGATDASTVQDHGSGRG